jgi:hypothetical protein
MKHDPIKNLDPVKKGSPEAKARGKQGGIKSGIAKRQKRLMSEVYAEVLAEMYGVDGGDLKKVVKDIIKQRAPHSVSMLKEVREATEGQKMTVEGQTIVYIDNAKKGI